MRTPVGLWLCLTAGCAVPPAVDSPSAASEVVLERSFLSQGPTVPETQSLPLRIGVEFLPPTPTQVTPQNLHGSLSGPLLAEPEHFRSVTVEPDRPAGPVWEPRETLLREPKLPWNLEKHEIASISDPFERATVHLAQELMGYDHRRARRDLGTPIISARHQDLSSPNFLTYLDERNLEDEQRYLSDRGRRFVRKPFRRAFKSFRFFQNIELALDEIKGEQYVDPDSPDAYEEKRSSRTKLGRFSARVRLTNSSDPLELYYKRSGLKVGTSQEKFRAGYRTLLADDISFSVSTRYEYDTDHFGVHANLTYIVDEKTSAHLIAGDDVDLLYTAGSSALMGSPSLEGSHGLLFYVEHLF